VSANETAFSALLGAEGYIKPFFFPYTFLGQLVIDELLLMNIKGTVQGT
jgi:hypothetical protein